MGKPCGHKNPLQREGKSRSQRFTEALGTDYVLVDERSTADLLVYASRLARQIQYYSVLNEKDGDWRDFIDGDISTRISLMMITDLDSLKEGYDLLRESALGSFATEAEAIEALQEVFEFLLDAARTINNWTQEVLEHEKFRDSIVNHIKSRLRRHMKNLVAYQKGSTALEDPAAASPLITLDYSGLSTDWYKQPSSGDISFGTWVSDDNYTPPNVQVYGNGTFDERRAAIMEKLDFVFRGFFEGQLKIVNDAEGYLNETLGDWDCHDPHMALFISFLLLFKHAQDHINTLTERHLDFYYQRVLQLSEAPAEPDEVHVVFTLAKNVVSHKVEAGTELKAGKDADGKELIYTLDDELVANASTAAEFKTVFIDFTDDDHVYAAPIANSEDGLGGEFDADEQPGWRPFGEADRQTGNEVSLLNATMGFAIAAPILGLAEGQRCIRFDITLSQSSSEGPSSTFLQDMAARVDESWFTIHFTAEKEWMKPDADDVTVSADFDDSGPHDVVKVIVHVTLDEEADPIVDYDSEVHLGTFGVKRPMVKFEINQEFTNNPYADLRWTLIDKIDISVDVRDVRSLVVQNDVTVLNADKTFQPFGSEARSGANFYIGSQEIFSKKLDSFRVNIDWANLPDNFCDHYQEYSFLPDGCKPQKKLAASPPVSPKPGADLLKPKFVLSADILSKRKWVDIDSADNVKMFLPQTIGTPTAADPDCNLANTLPASMISLEFNLDPNNKKYPAPNEDLEPFTSFVAASKQGFIRLTLGDQDFGHEEFVGLYTRKTVELSKAAKGAETDAVVLPNNPYTPEIKGISMDYRSSVSIELTLSSRDPKQTYEDRVEKCFHIRPFGQEEVHPYIYDPGTIENDESDATGGDPVVHFLPQYEGEGTLYIGIKDLNLEKSSTIALLFQVQEGTAIPDIDKPRITWAYRAKGKWKELEIQDVIADGTNGLVTSGILKLNIPQDAVSDHTILTDDLHWVRGTVEKDSGGVADIVAVHAQAAKATFKDNANAANHLAEALKAKTISKLKVNESEVKSIEQPYASFNGKMVEESSSFYTRVSERLRHKDRAITIWDYETMVLEKFPSVYRAKCLNHTSSQAEIAPGHVILVVVSNLINKNEVDPLKPRISVNTRDEIKKFLSTKISHFVVENLLVLNPTYEEVKVDFKVEIREGFDEGFYIKQLNEDIVRFLTPWAYEDGADISFEGRLHSSVILDFVEERPYVDYLTDFRMYHFPASNKPGILVEEAIATTPKSILVSAKKHMIKPVSIKK